MSIITRRRRRRRQVTTNEAFLYYFVRDYLMCSVYLSAICPQVYVCTIFRCFVCDSLLLERQNYDSDFKAIKMPHRKQFTNKSTIISIRLYLRLKLVPCKFASALHGINLQLSILCGITKTAGKILRVYKEFM